MSPITRQSENGSPAKWVQLLLAATLCLLAACAPQKSLQRAPEGTALASQPSVSSAPQPPIEDNVAAPTSPADAQSDGATVDAALPGHLNVLVPEIPLSEALGRDHGFPDCQRLSARAQRWREKLDRQSTSLARDFQELRPLLDLVASELERSQLPIALTMLPMIESHYVAHSGSEKRPAGIWQLMAQTARGLDVPIKPGYDGRLDYYRSTQAATVLLQHLAKSFNGDWRLIVMAYNAGEFRVKKALRRASRNTADIDLDALGLSKITLHHLAKLEAMACLFANNQTLSDAIDMQSGDALVALPLPAPIRVEFLAHLAGIPASELRRWNPALGQGLTPAIATINVLLPVAAARRADALLVAIPESSWARWQPVAGELDEAEIRRQFPELADAVIEFNKLRPDDIRTSTPRATWLPTASAWMASTTTSVDTPIIATHTVRNGDSLWRVAKRHGIALKRLMQWNGLNKSSVLKPGQKLRLRAP